MYFQKLFRRVAGGGAHPETPAYMEGTPVSPVACQGILLMSVKKAISSTFFIKQCGRVSGVVSAGEWAQEAIYSTQHDST